MGHRAILATPLVREGKAIGAIVVRKLAPVPFEEKQIKLIESFADQVVIAIENVRLFNETKESLEQQTAVSDVLQSIGESAFDLTSVLRTIADNAGRLTHADTMNVNLIEGREMVMVVRSGPQFPPFHVEGNRLPLDESTLAGRAVLTLKTQYILDVRDDPVLPQTGPRTRLLVPMVNDGKAVGVTGVAHIDVKAFSSREIALMETFARQAAIAVANVRLFNETTEALERQTAVSEILRVISESPTEIQPVLDAIARNAARYCGAEDCGVALVRPGGMLEQVAQYGQTLAQVGFRLLEIPL